MASTARIPPARRAAFRMRSAFSLRHFAWAHAKNAVAINLQGYSNSSTIVNSTFVDNTTGLFTKDVVQVYNSIFWNNETSINAALDVVGVEATLLDVMPVGQVQGNVWVADQDAPSPLNADYTINENADEVMLADGSYIYLIDSGDDAVVRQNVDLAGNTRIVGDSVDLGAYEVQTSSSALIDEAFADYFEEFFE